VTRDDWALIIVVLLIVAVFVGIVSAVWYVL
jgi:hypothetical protein